MHDGWYWKLIIIYHGLFLPVQMYACTLLQNELEFTSGDTHLFIVCKSVTWLLWNLEVVKLLLRFRFYGLFCINEILLSWHSVSVLLLWESLKHLLCRVNMAFSG